MAPATEPPDPRSSSTVLPRVTVIIPTRNRSALLLRSLSAALGQLEVGVEVVIVDDGSSAPVASLPALQSILADRRVMLLRNERSEGVAAARNRGIAAATTRWVAFLDDDDLWAPGKLRAQLNALAEEPGSVWAYTGEVVLRNDLTVLWANGGPPAHGIDAVLLENNRIPGGGSSVVVARDVVARLGGFDESFSILADWDLWLRLALRWPAAAVKAPMVGYVQHPGGMSFDIRRSLAELDRIEEKYRDIRQARGIALGRHDYLLWLAGLDRRSGRPWRAARLSVEAAILGRDPRAVAFAAATVVWPGFGPELDRRAGESCPIELREAAEDWLSPIRSTPKVEDGENAATNGAGGPGGVAILPWGNVIEDYLDGIGCSLSDFAETMTGGWLFGYVEALQSAGIRPVLICVSSGVERPVQRESSAYRDGPLAIARSPRLPVVAAALRSPVCQHLAGSESRASRGGRGIPGPCLARGTVSGNAHRTPAADNAPGAVRGGALPGV